MIFSYVVAVLLSAALLFVLEPMFARMVLPRLGGSPAVWNTALVFYQVALLAGYGYVHWSTTRLGVRRQAIVHLALMAAALVLLPIAVPGAWQPPADANPIPSLLGVLALAVGVPFLVVSTTGPLLQKWFSATRHPLAADPYFLYAASNVGSMVGLLSYPLLIEPRLTLEHQSRLWTWGYGLLAVVIVLCAWLMRRAPAPVTAPSPTAVANSPPPAAARRLRWVLLAFAPSSLMMGATTHVTTDVAAVPLLWVAPLAIYLLSFILAFSRRALVPQALWGRALPLLVLPLLVVMVGRPAHPLLLIIGLHWLVLFVAAMVCHGELAKDRPPAEHLTEFFLWLALGGALGGVFNAIVAPLAFDAVVEYPLAIVLACMLVPARVPGPSTVRQRVLDVLLPAALGGIAVLVVAALKSSGTETTRLTLVLLAAFLTFPIYSFSRRPLRFALGVAAVLVANPLDFAQGAKTLHAERSFFGLHRVLADPQRGLHALYHGTTLHGVQRFEPRSCGTALGYYGRNGGLREVFDAVGAAGGIRAVAVAGLGTGGIAAYARAGQRWTFFEIDPEVERIASDPRYFCFLAESPAETRVVLGDARLAIAARAERYDLLILDAYSSDAIPVHLLTREALELYQSRLTPTGVLVFHISNQYFDLAPVVARLAADAGLSCWVKETSRVSASDLQAGLLPSTYAVVARAPEHVGGLPALAGWHAAPPSPAVALWTDDYSSLFSVLRGRSAPRQSSPPVVAQSR